MFQTQLINQVVEWERRMEIEEQNRKNHRFEDVFTHLPSNSETLKIEREPFFKRLAMREEENHPVNPCCAPQRLHGA